MRRSATFCLKLFPLFCFSVVAFTYILPVLQGCDLHGYEGFNGPWNMIDHMILDMFHYLQRVYEEGLATIYD